MKRIVLSLCVLSVAGCKKEEARAPAASAAFDRAWSDLEKKGAEPAYIEGELHGAGLMGEVRRAVDPIGAERSPLAGGALEGLLPDQEVVKVIKANLPAVKSCYQVEERNGIGSGKAIVSLEIDGSGSVTDVKVDAPAFQGSGLPVCVGNRARNWSFPKFSQGPKRFSYPFVFVGG